MKCVFNTIIFNAQIELSLSFGCNRDDVFLAFRSFLALRTLRQNYAKRLVISLGYSCTWLKSFDSCYIEILYASPLDKSKIDSK